MRTTYHFLLPAAPDDYSPVDELLTFSPSRTSVTIPINIAPSVLNEQGESFFADLTLVSSGDDNVILEPDEAEVLIAPVGGKSYDFTKCIAPKKISGE